MDHAVQRCTEIYAIDRWGEGYFGINEQGHLCARPDPRSATEIDLAQLSEEIAEAGLALPVLVRFSDILRHRVRSLHQAFADASAHCGYQGGYQPVYPIKVNQQAGVVREILHSGDAGLEAGSKPELMAVLALSPPGGLVICNGYKDREYIRLALIGRRLGLRVYLVIEKPSEVPLILEEAERLGVEPLLGVRVRLAAAAAGNWQSSGGEKAKFGLAANQILQLVSTLAEADRLDWLCLLHAHLGSQIPSLQDIRAGAAELVRFYAELRRLGAPIGIIDVGGGLGVDYEGTRTRNYCSVNYGLDGYAAAIVTTIAEECRRDGLPEPHLLSESGRAMTAHHAVLITNVIDREHASGQAVEPRSDETDATLTALSQQLRIAAKGSPQEIYAESRELLHAARERFAQNRLDLVGRARAEELFFAICRALAGRLDPGIRRHRELADEVNALLADKLFCNFSLFQSLPDIWALDQIFPIVPIQRLDEKPTSRAVVHDLTCDSDGCIAHYVDEGGIEASLPVHADAGTREPYLLGFFMVGAYQEILGDIHNLFGDTDAVNVELDPSAPRGYRLLEAERGDTTDELLSYVHFEPRALLTQYRRKLEATGLDRPTRERLFVELKAGLYGYTYLET
ncbi:biosynthetic arginine decarboxylase [Thiorhodococcus mannitoliphagus]|uniref:Arginine decarboxylase n=1 Tax=Thiorhodococcus mannitoliphagus TaxID=329406 RepID=A0A6P1DUG8_9GAMM|nr:biosynthetic arginine decarboxylase [Thiorhodococcus mannitoliphagus]NEX19344.1 biosynthetic arginine decarboxylase [Thiorhodococcus mannitoliphagus]